MGQSTDAILFYGFCWEDETSKPWTIGSDTDTDEDEDEDDEDWEERYAKAMGAIPPTETYPDGKYNSKTREYDHTPEQNVIVEKYRAFWTVKRELAAQSGCEVDTHCSGECPMPFVAITTSKKRAWRGCPVEVADLSVDPSWANRLADFCQKLGIKTGGLRLGWWLVSDWN